MRASKRFSASSARNPVLARLLSVVEARLLCFGRLNNRVVEAPFSDWLFEDIRPIRFVWSAELLIHVFLNEREAVLFVPVPVAVAVSPQIKIFPAFSAEAAARGV